MDDLFWVFFIIVFIVAPLLERVLKGGRKPPPGKGGPGRPPARRRLPDGRTTTLPTRRPAQPARGEDATDLIPADLWEVLTGQRRPPGPAPTGPAPAPRAPEWGRPEPEWVDRESPEPEVTSASDEESAVEDLLRRRERATEVARRVESSHPTIVSLETEPLPEARRHSAFHTRLEGLEGPARARRIKPRMELGLEDPAALRRAIVFHEVFGPPRGLE